MFRAHGLSAGRTPFDAFLAIFIGRGAANLALEESAFLAEILSAPGAVADIMATILVTNLAADPFAGRAGTAMVIAGEGITIIAFFELILCTGLTINFGLITVRALESTSIGMKDGFTLTTHPLDFTAVYDIPAGAANCDFLDRRGRYGGSLADVDGGREQLGLLGQPCMRIDFENSMRIHVDMMLLDELFNLFASASQKRPRVESRAKALPVVICPELVDIPLGGPALFRVDGGISSEHRTSSRPGLFHEPVGYVNSARDRQ